MTERICKKCGAPMKKVAAQQQGKWIGFKWICSFCKEPLIKKHDVMKRYFVGNYEMTIVEKVSKNEWVVCLNETIPELNKKKGDFTTVCSANAWKRRRTNKKYLRQFMKHLEKNNKRRTEKNELA